MATEFLTRNSWRRITAAAKKAKRPALVAVAFFGKDGPAMLPIPPGSRLAVNASIDSVKKGLTHPESLRQMIAKGISVFSVENLHAKVFVLGTRAFIGSANASKNSASRLLEAVIETTDRHTVAYAQSFIDSQCLVELGPEELAILQKHYRPPVVFSAGSSERNNRTSRVRRPRLHVAHPEWRDHAHEEHVAEVKGRKDARGRMTHPRKHDLDTVLWSGRCTFQVGDQIVCVTQEENGTTMVSPPGKVLSTRPWSNGQVSGTIVYIETPKYRRKNFQRLVAQLGYGAKTGLLTDGIVWNEEFANRLRRAWRTR